MKIASQVALASQAMASSSTLPGYPLAVKTPYLSAWLRYNESTQVSSAVPFFWQGQPLTWQVLARVDDNATYCLFGCESAAVPVAQQTGISYTSTHTLIDLTAGSTDLVLDFFSPVSLTDYVRQSIPYSYLRVHNKGDQDGGKLDVMMAIDDTWTSQQPATQSELLQTPHGARGFILSGTESYTWAENNQMAAWGEVVLAARKGSSYQSGTVEDLVSQFSKNGCLSDQQAQYASGDLVGVASSLQSSGESVVFAIGVQQENAFNWLNVSQTGYYQASLNGTEAVVDHFFHDMGAALKEGTALDKRIMEIGQEISHNYTDVLASTVRQIWGSFQVLIPLQTKNTSQARAWIKEISTDGNVQTVADLLPKIFPAFYVLAPDYIRLSMIPLLEFSLTWPGQFAFHDLGKKYPNATGETIEAQEALILDQTAVMLWMVYAYQRASGDTDFVKPYMSPLRRFADYLVTDGLYPASQRSSVDSIGPTPNQTVLAIYSAIGLTAYGALTGEQNYTTVGKSFVPTILKLGLDPDKTHITAHYGDNASSWINTYPFAYDKMLALNTFNESVYELQSKWYETQLDAYGMPFFSGVNYTVGDLMAWAAATSSDHVRDALINGIHAFLNDGLNSQPGPTQWFVTGNQSGVWQFSIAKGNVGSYFMPSAVTRYQN